MGGYVEVGAVNSASSSFQLFVSTSGSFFLRLYDSAAGENLTFAQTADTARYTGTRTSNTNLSAYKNKTNIGNQTTSSNIGGTLPTNNIFAWAQNNQGSPVTHSERRMSEIYIFSKGLTSAELSTFIDLMDTYTTAIGA